MKLTIYDLEKENSEEIFDLPNGDTHPMRSPINENLFILDSYPDKLRDQHLFLFDLQTKNLKKIASFYSPFKYRGQVRCDLHPRWDREGKYVVVDSARDDRRKMFLINVHENST
jgi:Tol biopolymer transport system component